MKGIMLGLATACQEGGEEGSEMDFRGAFGAD